MNTRYLVLFAVAMIFLPLSAAVMAAEPAVSIVVAKAKQNDAGVSLAVEDLTAALEAGSSKVSVAYHGPDAPLPPGSNMILVGTAPGVSAESWKPDKPEGFRIRPLELSGRRVLVVEGDQRGLMYGVFKLAERIRLGEELWQIKIESVPAFPLRIFSEEGQLLDLPDVGYYSDEPPYVNEARLRKEVEELKRLMDRVAGLGFNTFCILHGNIEEYIDYRYLDKQVYIPNDRHRVRSPVFCKHLKELCDYAHSLHLDVYVQIYEYVYPPRLAEFYGVDLHGPNMERILNARYRELFERVPLDGMIITATEQNPRCGYEAACLWRNRADAGCMAVLYHNACKAAGGKCIFRMWRVAYDAEGFREVARAAPDELVFSIKNTGGDYYLDHATTDAITSGLAKEQPLVVLFDTFREFDGWSRLFCYMKRWGKRVRACRDGGVIGINAWGSWAPGCNWPDTRNRAFPTMRTPCSWIGHWSMFRMFTHGFTPGQANVYLIGRLAWDPDVDVEEIARDFAALHLGPANVEAGAKAILATEDAFHEEYVRDTHPCYIKWTMIFALRDKMMEQAYRANPLEDVLASNARALTHVDRMEKAFSQVDPDKAPDPKRYAAFKEGIDKTALYLRTFYTWRECWWRHRASGNLRGAAQSVNAAALALAKARCTGLFDQWQRYPEEAGHWRVTYRYGRPEVPLDRDFPSWYQCRPLTMEEAIEGF